GRPVRGRGRPGERRHQQVQAGLRRPGGAHLRLHAAGHPEGPHLARASRRLAQAQAAGRDASGGVAAVSLVSVIVPTYNRAESSRAAIASVQRQPFVDWELIVVDDGSTDGTASLIEASDPRLVLIRQANQGVNAARNAAMLRARGRYIAFLDSDDE